jgi:small multidrug resistance pump
MWGWIYLIVAVVTSVAAWSCLKLVGSFTKITSSILIIAFFSIDTIALSLSLRELDIGIVYAVWTGLSTTLSTIIGFLFFKEPAKLLKIISMALIMIGIVILKTV